MPELPELELLRAKLGEFVVGRRIERVALEPSRAFIIRYPPERFAAELAGAAIDAVRRHGKFLVFDLAGAAPRSLIVNPMLGGRFAFCGRVAPELPNTCFTLQFERYADLRFLDGTRMARIYLSAQPDADVPGYSEVGPDALAEDLTYDVFEARLRRHRGELKNLLRNQSFVGGVGNAYADEILFAARLSPLRRASTLTPAQRRALYDAMRGVLAGAVATTRRQYDAGMHPLHKQERGFLNVHGKNKTVCPRCGHRISVIHAGGQATYFCRGCQA